MSVETGVAVRGLLPGRDPDVAVVHAFVDRALVSGGGLLVTGGPGYGKSALLDAAARYGSAQGARIVRAAGSESLGTADYAALDQLLEPLHAHLPQLPEQARETLLITRGVAAGPIPGRLAISASVLALLRLAGANRPLLVLVENAHKLDRATALVLAFVARRLIGEGVGLLVEVRTQAGTPGILERCRLPRHRVGPLDDDAADRLLLARYPATATRVRDRLVAEAAGNPLVLLDQAAALGARRRAGHEPLPALLPLSDRLDMPLRRMLTSFPPATRAVLLLAALGESGDLGLLQRAAPGEDTLDAVTPAQRANVVTVDKPSRRIVFTHPVFRTAVIRFATGLERRRAQQALAATLADDPVRQAWHLADAAEGPDGDLAERLRQVADAAVREGAAVTAGAALIRSAELSPDPRARVRRLLEAAFIQADATGDLSDAVRLLDRARASGAELADSLPIEVVVSYVVVNGEMPTDAARALLVAAIDAYPGHADAGDDLLTDALHLLMLNCWTAATPEAWAEFERVVRRLRPAMPPLLEICARSFGDAGRLTPRLLHEITVAAEALGEEYNPVVITRTALACVYTDQLSSCLEPLARVIRYGRRTGAMGQALQAAVSTCTYLWQSGQWTELMTTAAGSVAQAEQYGYHRYQVLLGGYHPALVAAARGDEATVRVLLDEMTAWAGRRVAGNVVQFAHHVRAVLAIGRGDFERAFQEASAVSPAGTLRPYTPNALWLLLELVEGAVRSGRHDAAQAHVEAMAGARLARISPRLAMVTAGCRAMVTGDDADFEEALAVPDAQRWPFDLARVELAYGEHLRRRHDPAGSRLHLIAALEIFQRLGAQPWADRAGRELRTAGRGSGFSTGGLSAQERRIAELAAAGLSNKEIGRRLHLSHRTVGAHLYRVFPKLGVTSRAGLRDALSR
ncbi:LuxR C-terminal-related transcriptional regulator [Actinoplanes solisilvae]|uniref:LuxR C-terminal-related transcriptional regulator n=1 Tax=Actinoplanes solisilvae TaxID=2486853 RepID=UPI000FDB1DCF|nr:LuxR family transcriptional regulator [Actinoplanes solisilvae]